MIKTANKIRKIKADRLISITSVKEGGDNTLYYHFSRNNDPGITEVAVKVSDAKEAESIISIYENAALLEAEVTELFGIRFRGNDYSGKRLFQAEEDGKVQEWKCQSSSFRKCD